jgi:hypothetical protein
LGTSGWPLSRSSMTASEHCDRQVRVVRALSYFLKRPVRCNFAHTPVEFRQWPRSPNADFLDDFGKRPLAKYTGHSTKKPPRARLGSTAHQAPWLSAFTRRR